MYFHHLLVLWWFVGLFGGGLTSLHLHEDRGWSTRKVMAAWVILFVTAPVVAPLALFYGLFFLGKVIVPGFIPGIKALGLGFVDLYRHFFPAKVKLPKARVL